MNWEQEKSPERNQDLCVWVGGGSFLGARGDSGTWRLFSHRDASQRPELRLLTGAAHSWKGQERGVSGLLLAEHSPGSSLPPWLSGPGYVHSQLIIMNSNLH